MSTLENQQMNSYMLNPINSFIPQKLNDLLINNFLFDFFFFIFF